MSRIGRKTINIPAGVTVSLASDNTVTVKGPKGTLTQKVHPSMTVNIDGSAINVTRSSDDKYYRGIHGLTRTLIYNMVEGVVSGYTKTLEIEGVGYKAVKQGKTVTLTIGYSHPVIIEENEDIKLDLPNPNTIVITGPDKQKVGQYAAVVRAKRPPEPYHGKGIRYAGEHIRMKEGKAGKK